MKIVYDTLNALADKSLQEYINLLRLEEARRMLDGVSKFTLETVATDFEFNTYRNFYRFFLLLTSMVCSSISIVKTVFSKKSNPNSPS